MSGLFSLITAKRQSGKRAEDLALAYLKQYGLRLVTRNYQCRAGEIDLIMRDRQELVFIEVRFRKYSQFGSGAESVDARKQRKLIMTAQHFLQTQNNPDWPACRFDVVAARPVSAAKSSLHLDWIKNAFHLQ